MASVSLSKAEKSFIQAGLLYNPPSRADGRSLLDFRNVALETGVAPLANGSARLNTGRSHDGGGGTEVLAASKLEVENVNEEGADCMCSFLVCVAFSPEYFCTAGSII
jgi:exosome complex component RRP42